jgi:hypothetical protein
MHMTMFSVGPTARGSGFAVSIGFARRQSAVASKAIFVYMLAANF